jgi:hypothetical protein
LPSPQFNEAYARVFEVVKQTLKQVPAGSALAANMTGVPANAVELADIGERDLHVIEIAMVIMVLLMTPTQLTVITAHAQTPSKSPVTRRRIDYRTHACPMVVTAGSVTGRVDAPRSARRPSG